MPVLEKISRHMGIVSNCLEYNAQITALPKVIDTLGLAEHNMRITGGHSQLLSLFELFFPLLPGWKVISKGFGSSDGISLHHTFKFLVDANTNCIKPNGVDEIVTGCTVQISSPRLHD